MDLIRYAAAAALLCALAAPAAAQTYQLEASTPLLSTDTGWDYITLQPGGTRLFMARRKDGLTVFDTETRLVVGTIGDSAGANGAVLVPEFGRGYAAMLDGTVLTFDLATLRPIGRVRVDDGDLNQGVYDPATKRVHFVTGSRPETSTWITLDAATGQVLGRTAFASKKMDTPAPDGQGGIYAPMRDQNVLLKLRASDLAIEQRWPLGACVQPVAVEYEHGSGRVLIGCRGERPVLVAVDPADGRVVATVPIGRGVDGLVFDEARRLIITANGGDATLSLIQQDGADSYKLVETIGTRPMARVLQLDPRTKRLYSVAAAYSVPGPDAQAAAYFHPNSFTVLTFMRPHGP